MLLAHGVTPLVWDVDAGRREFVAERLARASQRAREALACEVVVTVTPGADVLYSEDSLEAGQHVSLMGADGPGKAEVAIEELRRAHVFCDDWDQAEPRRRVGGGRGGRCRHARNRHRARRRPGRRRRRPSERGRHARLVRLDRARDPRSRDRQGRPTEGGRVGPADARAVTPKVTRKRPHSSGMLSSWKSIAYFTLSSSILDGPAAIAPPASTSSSKNLSKPAGAMISRIRHSSSPAFQNVCHCPRGLWQTGRLDWPRRHRPLTKRPSGPRARSCTRPRGCGDGAAQRDDRAASGARRERSRPPCPLRNDEANADAAEQSAFHAGWADDLQHAW